MAQAVRIDPESSKFLVDLTSITSLSSEHSLALARYLVEQQDLGLWGKALVLGQEEEDGAEPPHRRVLVDHVMQTALPETKNPDMVSYTVKAFMANDLTTEIIELLDRILLQESDFSDNKNLQNLLILTAMKEDPPRVMSYITRLDNFDGESIAEVALGEQYMLYEEAFSIYAKFAQRTEEEDEQTKLEVLAVTVLVDKLHAIERAKEFAGRANKPQVWSKVPGAVPEVPVIEIGKRITF